MVTNEYRVMSGLHHDGLLRPDEMVDAELGLGQVYPLDPEAQRLDLWPAGKGDALPMTQRLAIVRQVAETVHYAHRNPVVHRDLTPHALWVTEGPSGLKVKVGDWQSAGNATPATSAADLRGRLRDQGGLDLGVDLPQVPFPLRTLILTATHPRAAERTGDVGAFLEGLTAAEQALTEPDTDQALDPLEARPGDLLDGRFRLQRRLGAGSTAVGLLVTDESARNVRRFLKVALGTILNARADEVVETARLVPLVAGLAELQRWVQQWHGGYDAELGTDMAQFTADLLRDSALEVGRTMDQLAAWQPAAPAAVALEVLYEPTAFLRASVTRYPRYTDPWPI